jgi:hypothetical protein
MPAKASVTARLLFAAMVLTAQAAHAQECPFTPAMIVLREDPAAKCEGRETPQSPVLTRVEYCVIETRRYLFLTSHRHTEPDWAFLEVKAETWKAFLAAPSPDDFIKQQVIPNYECRRIR